MRRFLISVGGVVLAVACSSQKPVAKIDDSGLARLNEAQMEPVDSARVEEGRAQDALAKVRAREADARAHTEVAKSERGVADAQLKRALAERDLLKKQYASNEKMAEIDQEISASRDRVQASDLKSQYLQLMISVAEAERRLAEAHVLTAQALTEQAKHQAMRAGNVPEAASMNAGEIDRRVADAQGREASLRSEIAKRRSNAVDVYNRWQQADARARTLARPSPMSSVPPPTGEPTSN